MAGHQLWGLLLGISLVTIGLGGLALADCPEVCTCKWKGGKQTVECINASLSSIPSLEAGTQVLDLSLNYLPTLRTDTFSKHNLTNLQKIYLPRCSLRILEVHTFRGLTNLVDLDLSDNALDSIPTPAVEDCKYLMKLALRSNPIRSVGEEAFRGLHELVHLDLSECGLEEVHPYAFRGLDSLEYLRLEANRLTTLSPTQSFPPNLRDLKLHQNKWHCDCHLLNLRNWLQNFTVPNSIEPRCHSPPRLISESIKKLVPSEFACIPKVSPTSMYLEVIEGKNMSLVCSIEAIPEASISWKYKETDINNGSTLVNDIDMRYYFYIETGFGSNRKSELFLSATSVDDNGTFACIAENKAGKARAEFKLHVVVPMPPKPPQDVVEERFRTEYLIAIVVAVVLLLIISLVVTTLLAMRCQRSRAKRLRAAAIESGKLHRSRSGGDLSNTDTTIATQMTPAASYAGSANGSVPSSSEILCLDSNTSQQHQETNPDILKHTLLKQPLGDEIRLAMLKNASSKKAAPSTASASTLEMEAAAAVVEAVASTTRLHLNNPTTTTTTSAESPPAIPKRSTSYDVFRYTKRQESLASAATSEVILPKLSPPTPFADESFVADTLPHLMSKNEALMSKTLPRRMPTGNMHMQGPQLEHRKSLTDTTIPPPPQYKGVHFAPQVEHRRNSEDADEEADLIPVEGLPTRPAAMPKQHVPPLSAMGETIAIQVRKTNPVPLLTSVTSNGHQSSFEQPPQQPPPPTENKIKRQPPLPPPKTSTLSSSMAASSKGQQQQQPGTIKGVRDKALAASAAGCEIVFVSPDEGFNEEVVVTSMASDYEASKSKQ